MQELANALEAAPAKLPEAGVKILTQAAADWASWSVLNLSDPLLDKALAISIAIARFTAAFESLHPSPQSIDGFKELEEAMNKKDG